MSPKADLEQRIRKTYNLWREYEDLNRLSSDPKEHARAQRDSQDNNASSLSDWARDFPRRIAVYVPVFLEWQCLFLVSGFVAECPRNSLPFDSEMSFF